MSCIQRLIYRLAFPGAYKQQLSKGEDPFGHAWGILSLDRDDPNRHQECIRCGCTKDQFIAQLACPGRRPTT